MLKKRITELQKKLKKIEKDLSQPDFFKDTQKSAQILKLQSEIKENLNLWEKYQKTKKQIKEAEELLNDADLGEMAEAEIKKLKKKKNKFKTLLSIRLSPEYKKNNQAVVLEIRAGAGGEEAALFAQSLLRMYLRFAERKGWRASIIDSHSSELKGLKTVILEIKGLMVYGNLKYESGVHRVQRVPATEKNGRIHTSAASVAVLPLRENPQIKIKDEDLRIDVFRSSGPGGQSVNTTDSAVRVTHLPTAISVSCQDEKSQHKNKAKALNILKSKLLQLEEEKKAQERSNLRNSQIGAGDRSEKIRTYNFPQDRVTDHRIKKSWYGIEKILDGEITRMIKALQSF